MGEGRGVDHRVICSTYERKRQKESRFLRVHWIKTGYSIFPQTNPRRSTKEDGLPSNHVFLFLRRRTKTCHTTIVKPRQTPVESFGTPVKVSSILLLSGFGTVAI